MTARPPGPAHPPRLPTLVDLVRWRAERHGDRPALLLLGDGERETAGCSYAELDRDARALAVGLMERAAPGERVLLLFPTSLDYPVAFLACLYAGLVAVPAYPPDPSRAAATLPRIRRIVNDADARVILSTEALFETAQLARAQACDPARIVCLSIDRARPDWAEGWRRPPSIDGGLAFLQYTSGSTGTPRGVMVSHHNLMDHQEGAHGVFQGPEGATTVSWLPCYHDMGLIGGLLYPLHIGGRSVLMPPAAFVRRPLRWLEAITRYRADTSTGPNFAYELCVQRSQGRSREAGPLQLDLSSWRLTVCGAEPLRADTLERFHAAFAPYGFRKSAFLPCHGMAEATLMVSGGRWDRDPPIRYFADAPLLERRAVAVAAGSPGARAHVACGAPAARHELRIVDPEASRPCDDGVVGEIWVRGPSVARGYWQLPERSAEVFGARIEGAASTGTKGADPWLRTGDLAFLHGGELFVVGRLADLVVDHHGRWLYPHLLERALEGLEAVDGDIVALPRPGEARGAHGVVIALESRRRHGEATWIALGREVRRRLEQGFGIEGAGVLVVPPRSVPKTTSGKIRRHAWREALAAGTLELLWSDLPWVPAARQPMDPEGGVTDYTSELS